MGIPRGLFLILCSVTLHTISGGSPSPQSLLTSRHWVLCTRYPQQAHSRLSLQWLPFLPRMMIPPSRFNRYFSRFHQNVGSLVKFPHLYPICEYHYSYGIRMYLSCLFIRLHQTQDFSSGSLMCTRSTCESCYNGDSDCVKSRVGPEILHFSQPLGDADANAL